MYGERGGLDVIMVSGYYGFANLGDEAILDSLCTDLTSLGFGRKDILVLSANPELTEAQHGVRALPRYDLRQIWRALGSSRCLISGGGSLLQDVTSKRSIPYYLGLVELAQLRKVPVVMYGQGIGPVQSSFLRVWVKRSFQLSQANSVRDQGSLQLLRELGVDPKNIQLCADPVFGQARSTITKPQGRRLLLNLRPYSKWSAQKGIWLDLLREWHTQGFEVEFAPLGPGDSEIGESLKTMWPDLNVHPNLTLESYKGIYERASLCISMRLHGVIFSALQDVLPVGLNYDPKVEAISTQLGIPLWDLDDVASLGIGVSQVLMDLAYYKEAYQKALIELNKGALANRTMLAQVLK